MTHGHADHGHDGPEGERSLRLAFLLSLVVLAVELVGGWYANSLALMADAGHVLTDIVSLALAWFAIRQASRPSDELRTFGYHRTGILVALANAMALIAIAIFVAFAAYARLRHPNPVAGAPMLAAAAVGLALNLYVGMRLHGTAGHDLNVRSAMLHVLGDAAASAGVILAAIVVLAFRVPLVDPITSVAIAALIAVGAWRIVGEAVNILMEAVPPHIKLPEVVSALRAIPGVRDVHDLHVWRLAAEVSALSCHVLIDDQHVSQSASLLQAMERVLRDRFQITHATIQPECAGCDPDQIYCNFAMQRTPEGPGR